MKEINFKVKGMHCASCEHLVERKLRKQPGVNDVNVNRMSEITTLRVDDNFNLQNANEALKHAGYELVLVDAQTSTSAKPSIKQTLQSPMAKIWWTLFICAALVGMIWIFTNGVHLNSLDTGKLTDNVGPASAFVLGLIASISSCLAITGGLLLALTANIPDSKKWNFSISFGIGRLISYGILGGILGLVGAKLAFSTQFSAILTMVVSVIMILLGLQLIGIFKMPSFIPKKIVRGIENMAQNPRQTAFQAAFIGALTFFLPCGFTQSLQLFALQSGSFFTGALILFMFALGTMPVLMFVGSITKYISPTFRRSAMVVAGIVVIILALISIPSALTLYSLGGNSHSTSTTNSNQILPPTSVDSNNAAQIDANGVQEITTTVMGYNYVPNSFTVKVGVPVKWTVNGQSAAGCAHSLLAPEFGVQKTLSSSAPTVIEFTPIKKGTFQYSCSMGMAGPGTINVI